MNLFDCHLAGAGDDLHLVLGEVRVNLPARARSILAAGPHRALVAGIRPEHIRLVFDDSKTSATHAVRALIKSIEPLGNQTFVRIAMGTLALNVLLPADAPEVHPGLAVGIVLDPERLHCFVADPTGEVVA
jgi:ABC-type sugar transport system ATPase subunit